jgi:hypothetical protein
MRNISAAAILAMLLSGPTARAHAFLDHAEPRVGSTVPSAPRQLSLWFTQELEPAFSSADVEDANGARVDQGKAQISGAVMRVGLKALPPGTYKVHWKVISVDTHPTEGSFTFHVGK